MQGSSIQIIQTKKIARSNKFHTSSVFGAADVKSIKGSKNVSISDFNCSTKTIAKMTSEDLIFIYRQQSEIYLEVQFEIADFFY